MKDSSEAKYATLLEQLMPNGITRKLDAMQAFDLRDPNPSKNYGIGSLDLWFVVKRANVAVTWRLFTGWYLEKNRDRPARYTDGLGSIDWHSPVPLYVDQTPQHDCMHTGGDCYCDGSSLESNTLFNKWLEDQEYVWVELEEWLERTEKRIADERENARTLS